MRVRGRWMDKLDFSNLKKAKIVILSLFLMISLFILYLHSKEGLDTSDVIHLLIINILVSANLLYVVMMKEQIHVMGKRTKLSIEFERDNPAFIVHLTPTPPVACESRIVRLKINNNGSYIAKKCQGILDEIRNEKGEILYRCAPTLLHWSLTDPNTVTFMDISKYWFLEVAHAMENSRDLFIATIFGGGHGMMQNRLLPGTYVFTITICSENADPESVRLRIDWGGKWDQLEASVMGK